MKKSFFLSVFFILFSVNVVSQSKFGNATMDEMNMSVYEKDTTASALYLLKKGDTFYRLTAHSGLQLETTYQVKIKILKPDGLDYCNVSINYYEPNNTTKQRITGLNGTTYNLENGKIVKTKLSKEYITDQDVDDKRKVKKFTMQGAKVGSIIEYKYTVVSDFYYNIPSFYFQSSIPVQYASYYVRIPEYFTFNLNQQGYIGINSERKLKNDEFVLKDNRISFKATDYIFETNDVPALKNESYIWSLDDYYSKVTFEIKSEQFPFSHYKDYTTSWEKIDEYFLDQSSFGGNLKKEGLFKNEITRGDLSLERAFEIEQLIKSQVKWNDVSRFYPGNLKDVLKKGLGNSADMNFLLINALKATGFDAFPVILSTRKNGRLPLAHPSMDAFNYVITGIALDDKFHFTDASAKYGTWDILPEKCMVDEARIIRKNASSWVALSTLSMGTTLHTGMVTFTDSELKKKITTYYKGNDAYSFRNYYYSCKDQDEYLEKLSSKYDAVIEGFEIQELENLAESVKIDYFFESAASLDDDIIYINPMIDRFLTENPFKKEERIYPINFDYLRNYVQIVDIVIPEGYVVEELPNAEKFVFGDKQDIILSYGITAMENQIKVHYQYQLKRLLFLPDEYQALQEFFSKVIAKGAEMIVLKKG